MVLTSGRSGSNHLVAALNQHPGLCNFGEVLGDWTLPARMWSPFSKLGASQAGLLETVYTSRGVYYAAQSLSYVSRKRNRRPTHFRRRSQVQSLGVKEFFMHLRDPKVLAWFEECEDLSIVHLRREDRLAKALSVLRLDRNGRAVARVGDDSADALHIDPNSLLETLDALETEAQEEDEILRKLAHHKCLGLVHEHDFGNWDSTQAALARVHQFLEVEPMPLMDTGHRSSVKGRAIEAVQNREEIEKALLDSRHADSLARHR
ncbi:MAG: hypothetical protein QM477_09250 [Planctomycetota bacterium]